jgi:hypothetical protein
MVGNARRSCSDWKPLVLLVLVPWLAIHAVLAANDGGTRLPQLLAQPGVMWHQNAYTQGEHLKPLDTGTYVSQPFCDICPPSASFGSWKEQDGTIVLEPERPASKANPFEPGRTKRLLLEFENDGCPVLIDAETFKRIGFNGLAAFIVDGSPACKRWDDLKYKEGWVRPSKPLMQRRGPDAGSQ